MIGAIREVVADQFDLSVHAVVLIRLGTIPKTSSGKIQRFACHQAFLEGKLNTLVTSDNIGPIRSGERADPLALEIRDLAASLIEVSPQAIALDGALAQQGLDSLRAVELEAALEERFDFHVPMEELVGEASPNTLARMLHDAGRDVIADLSEKGANESGSFVAAPRDKIQIELSSLFETRRFASPLPAWLVAYAPIGMALAAARLAGLTAWFMLAMALGKRWGAKFIGMGAWLAGIRVRVRGRDNLAQAEHLVVANHIFTLEGFAWMSVRPSLIVVKGAVLKSLPYALSSRLVPLIVSDGPGAARVGGQGLLQSGCPLRPHRCRRPADDVANEWTRHACRRSGARLRRRNRKGFG